MENTVGFEPTTSCFAGKTFRPLRHVFNKNGGTGEIRTLERLFQIAASLAKMWLKPLAHSSQIYGGRSGI